MYTSIMFKRGKHLVSLCSKTTTNTEVEELTTTTGKSVNIGVYDDTGCENLLNNVPINAIVGEGYEKSENEGYDDTGCQKSLDNVSTSAVVQQKVSGTNRNVEGYVATKYETSLDKVGLSVNSVLDQSSPLNITLDTVDSTENVETSNTQDQVFVINEADGLLIPLVTSNNFTEGNFDFDFPIEIDAEIENVRDLVPLAVNNLCVEAANESTPSEGGQNSIENVSDFLTDKDSSALVINNIDIEDRACLIPEVPSCEAFNNTDLLNNSKTAINRSIRPISRQVSKNCQVNEPTVGSTLTKEGNPRKRKKYELSVVERNKFKRIEVAQAHFVKGSCKQNCKIKCFSKIPEIRQKEINKQYWELGSAQERKSFVLGSVSKIPVKRKTSGDDSRRSWTNMYHLKTDDGTSTKVCKVFFLNTLGYNSNNDKILQNLSGQGNKIAPKPDGRKGRIPKNKVDHSIIVEHIESFEPKISHYRREHAPNRRYLPSDLSVTQMYHDFLKRFPNYKISYDLYRSEVSKQNISFVKLGNEECEQCEHFNLHGHIKENLQENCQVCQIWDTHIKKADAARAEYKNDAATGSTDSRMVYSVDMEKVIMLPRCEMFKNVIFTKRLTVYNESYVPVGKKPTVPTVACLWHDAIRGRNKEELISTTYKFFITNCRDVENIVMWMDNCSSQNKNWAFYSFLLYCINSSEISAQTIEIKYFEPGHTFMSCDSFHHMVEKSLHRVKKVYDFEDFKQAVQSCSSKVNAIEMTPNDFFQWKDHSSKRTPKKGKKNDKSNTRTKQKTSTQKLDDPENEKENTEEAGGRPYLRDVVHVQARRGLYHLLYKASYIVEEWRELHFLTPWVLKNGLKLPPNYTTPVGISTSRKNAILKNLLESQKGIIPSSRFSFWENLPVSSEKDNQ